VAFFCLLSGLAQVRHAFLSLLQVNQVLLFSAPQQLQLCLHLLAPLPKPLDDSFQAAELGFMSLCKLKTPGLQSVTHSPFKTINVPYDPVAYSSVWQIHSQSHR